MRYLVRQLDGRAASLRCAVIVWLGLIPATVRSGETLSVSEAAPQAFRFVSPGQFLVDRVVTPISLRAERLLVGRSVNSPGRPRASRTFGPLRQFALVGGDRVSGEVQRWGDDAIELRLIGGQIVSVSKLAMETLHVPAGEVELLAERFENDDALDGFIDQIARLGVTLDRNHSASGECSLRLSSESKPLSVSCPAGMESARIQLWFHAERTSQSAISSGGRITFEFAESADAKSLVLELDAARLAVVGRQGLAGQWTTQAVELRSGWHCLTAILTPQRVLILVDESLLASSAGIDEPLRTIRLAARGGLLIDDLTISRLEANAITFPGSTLTADDVVATHSGEELFGRLLRVTSQRVTLDGIAGEIVLPWSRVAAIGFRPVDRPVGEMEDGLNGSQDADVRSSRRAASPGGIVARIEWTSLVDRPQLPPDRVTATILATDRDGLFVSHPLLGDFQIKWRDIRRIEPQFVGRDLLLDARCVHLGNSIRADFHRPLPDGTEWRREFLLAEMPLGDMWLSLNVADLEPCGPETPPGSPFLKELRAGRLLTEVMLNDQAVGDLNRHLRYRASSAHPDRLRCLLPRQSFRVGTNSLRLRQRPLTESGSEFDDCELSNLRLEWK